MLTALTILVVTASALLAQEEPPGITHVGLVAPHILGITVRAGRVEYGRQVPYEPQPGDVTEHWLPVHPWGWVRRNGVIIGNRITAAGNLLATFDRVVGAPLDVGWAQRPESYRISSPDDAAYGDPVVPQVVHRKSRPTDLARTGPWEFAAPQEHTLYLILPTALRAGCRYTLDFEGERLPTQVFTFDPATMRSEAVHVSHLGFRPDDPVKVAYLSCWMGDGGPLSYPEGMTFRVVDDHGREGFAGRVSLAKAADDQTEDVYKRNYNGTDVYVMDFSALRSPGTYRVVVDGIGCSYPFVISAEAWGDAFLVAAKGFYHQRSGIELGPPYTTLRRPRCFHPDDGVRVFASTCSLMDSGNGLNAQGTDTDNFGNLVRGKTDAIVPDAWGGYFDAGDWDRRIQHLEATRLLLELHELFPDFVGAATLHIPESGNGLPELISECLWNLDCYRRMQLPHGGIRGGIESAEHPQFGEGSWQEALPVMAYAPDMWSSYVYAGVGARAALALERRGSDRAGVYRDSALRAMTWAEEQYAVADQGRLPSEVRDARNLAAVELFRLTGEARWHELFAATTSLREPDSDIFVWRHHMEGDAAFVYSRLERPGTDPVLRESCRRALLRRADHILEQQRRTAFGWTKFETYQPVGWGVLGCPQVLYLLRAHALTGKPEYLAAAEHACLYSAGANPVNMCFTTGLGHRWPEHILWLDARVSHQPAPPGLTVFGPLDLRDKADHWAVKVISPFCYPPPLEWPTTEAYWDVFWFPEICEFTVNATMGPNTYAWGYLAARGPLSQ